ncbi:MAG TPA: glycosyltransferase family 4 protein [Streptosporangiaceae bacterium]|nr:glycosyltransferase family 4 protein [Streptosporangiaceae bacterium]
MILLTPSTGQGSGVERYLETIDWALDAHGMQCYRLGLERPGVLGHLRLLAKARALLRRDGPPARVVAGHRNLLPVALLAGLGRAVSGVSVLCHGSEVWDARWRPRRWLKQHLLRRRRVRAVAVSGFTAGVLARDCPARVLPPALHPGWFEVLAAAAARERVVRAADGSPRPVHLVTLFPLADWRGKGLPQLIEAVAALRAQGPSDLRLMVCGHGDPPAGLRALAGRYQWCTLRAGLADSELAGELARADLFVLATRTRVGRGAHGEGFGVALLEAQVAGTPVVAPAHGGSHETYLPGVTGAAPRDESAQALTEVLAGLLADPQRLAGMGTRAAQWAQEAFAPAHYPLLAAQALL